MRLKIKTLFRFSPDISFLSLWQVWITIIAILLAAGYLSYEIYNSSSYTFCHTANCYNSFLNDFKFPLGIVTLLIPILAIYAAQHRSEISIAQVKATESQNKFSNYYKHLEEFQRFIEKSDISDIRKLHKALFPNAKDGSYSIDQNLIANLIVALQKIHQTLKELERFVDSLNNDELSEREYTDKSVNLILVAYETLLNIRNSFKFNDTECSPKSLKEKLKKNEVNIAQVIYEIKTTLNCLEKVLSFDEEFDMPDVLIKLIELVLPSKESIELSIDNPIEIKLSNI